MERRNRSSAAGSRNGASIVVDQPAADRRADDKWRGEENHNAPEHAASDWFICLRENGLAHGAALREDRRRRQSF